jgi:ArsR family transcriptional regulator, arsenate/arsenite/antimonite-responsive transcriptional repressor
MPRRRSRCPASSRRVALQAKRRSFKLIDNFQWSTLPTHRMLPHFKYHQNMEETEVVRSLGALAQGSRLQIYRLLVVAGAEGMTPGSLAERLDVAAPTLSFHLKELTNAGLVTQERASRNLIYRASVERMNALLAYLTANCCQGEACLDATAAACKC